MAVKTIIIYVPDSQKQQKSRQHNTRAAPTGMGVHIAHVSPHNRRLPGPNSSCSETGISAANRIMLFCESNTLQWLLYFFCKLSRSSRSTSVEAPISKYARISSRQWRSFLRIWCIVSLQYAALTSSTRSLYFPASTEAVSCVQNESSPVRRGRIHSFMNIHIRSTCAWSA